ncbi:MAG: biotin carboxylase [Leptospiraceae bacterium]|nr:biotin carboxylase [Leptospiraceae bacterium]
MTVTKNRFLKSKSSWVQSFSCHELNVLIVCRGPIRKEAMDVFEELGASYGILLSEKDSVMYPMTLAPELRQIEDDNRVHRVADYMGVSAEERSERIDQIIGIAKAHGYTHIFAGYGFMAEDGEFVRRIEEAGLGFMGPASTVHYQAGAKDTAKVIAREAGVTVTPGIDNISALTLLRKTGGTVEALKKLAASKNLTVDESKGSDPAEYAEALLHTGYENGVGLISLDELQKEAGIQADSMFSENPGYRIRLKYIGGGGGKGQRIISKSEQAAGAVMEVLSESKAVGDSQNRNFLMELNVENTRHNEIQLIGNGQWAISLGGRDCSLQMHEQKLVELSITDELFDLEIQAAKAAGKASIAEQLHKDRLTLQKMESQAESFAEAVGLNSASTFECIVSGNDFYFMEMNTRIQVEHRVTEMVYSLQFTNPDNEQDSFIVESLVEAMALVAAHARRLPKPGRIVRNVAGGEVRLNAMNDALQPHAGGTIQTWSPPVKGEIRDDQGIGMCNPDTGVFIHYYLAGAYDSNIALVVAQGQDRRQNLERLLDILRRMEIRGDELKTNREFHMGILNFCLGLHPMLKPDTRFVVPYLAAVGSLTRELEGLDLQAAFGMLSEQAGRQFGADGLTVLQGKQTLLLRILEAATQNPHVLAGWLVRNRNHSFTLESERIVWHRNPLKVLADLYNIFHLEARESASPVHQIWSHDQEMMNEGLAFYKDLEGLLGLDCEGAWQESLAGDRPSPVFGQLVAQLQADTNPWADQMSDELFAECQAAHHGWQLGSELIALIIKAGYQSGVLDFSMNDRLEPQVPTKFLDAEFQEAALKFLAPPPVASADTIVAVSGGMFYSKETPAAPPYVSVGKHFNVGDPLYIIEVMKMFNKHYAEFAGVITEILVDGADGLVVKKGQPLYRVKPDEEIIIESESEKTARRRQRTTDLMNSILV